MYRRTESRLWLGIRLRIEISCGGWAKESARFLQYPQTLAEAIEDDLIYWNDPSQRKIWMSRAIKATHLSKGGPPLSQIEYRRV